MSFGNNDKKILEKVETYIANDVVINGSLNSKTGSLRIDGEVNGEFIKAKGVIIGEKAKITGNIEADMVIIAGEVKGNVLAVKKLEVLEKAKITGNLISPVISIMEGSVFEGNCKMLNTEQKDNSKK
ncbi:MAG: polymer-forming cytoskeletal protein [Elusimicrobiota bacterium]|jgi:cytoskeletal protein CcmA (bactofilin family)|nr:polymer-forming cytoskeletal protein [Elusimicrobiota bacterium]